MKNNNLRISVVMPSLNYGKYIEEAILSVINQNYPNKEIIIIDGGSTDNTIEVLNRYRDKIYWESSIDKSLYDAMNKGYERSTGDIFGWLSADDKYNDEIFNYINKIFSNKSEMGLIYGNYYRINKYNEIIKKCKTKEFNYSNYVNGEELLGPVCAIFFRRVIWEKYGPFDLRYKYAGDLDFFLRVGKSEKLMNIDINIGCFRIHHNQYTRSKDISINRRYLKEQAQICLKHGGSIFSKRVRRYLRKLILSLIKRN